MKSLKIALVVMVAVLFVMVVAVRAQEAPKPADTSKAEVKAGQAAEKADNKESAEARKEAAKEVAPVVPVDKAKLEADIKAAEAEKKAGSAEVKADAKENVEARKEAAKEATPAEPVDKAKLEKEAKAGEAELKGAKAAEKLDKEEIKADKGKEAEKKDVADTVAAHGQFKTLEKALADAGLTATLKGKGPVTLFAPNDEAFNKMPPKELEALLKDKAKLAAVLKKQIVEGKVTADQLAKMKEIKTLGGMVAVSEKEKAVMFGGAKVGKDIEAGNGLIIIVDGLVK